MSLVELYVDGASRSNGSQDSIGAYGVYLKYNEHTKELYRAFRNVTNNEMELLAMITGLKELKRKNLLVKVYSDSAYVVNGINNKWYKKWQINGWLTSSKTPVANRRLWQELVELIESFPFIEIIKVRGHSDCEGNIKADELCNIAMDELLS